MPTTFEATTFTSPRRLRPSEKIEILTKARNLIETKGWVKGAEFARANGEHVNNPKDAERFCAIGSVKAVSPKRCQEVIDILNYVAEERGFFGIDDLNDEPDTRRRDVVRAFNHAIRTVKEEAKNNVA